MLVRSAMLVRCRGALRRNAPAIILRLCCDAADMVRLLFWVVMSVVLAVLTTSALFAVRYWCRAGAMLLRWKVVVVVGCDDVGGGGGGVGDVGGWHFFCGVGGVGGGVFGWSGVSAVGDRYLTWPFYLIRKASRVRVFCGTFRGGRRDPCFYLFFVCCFYCLKQSAFLILLVLKRFFCVVAKAQGTDESAIILVGFEGWRAVGWLSGPGSVKLPHVTVTPTRCMQRADWFVFPRCGLIYTCIGYASGFFPQGVE